MELPVPFKIKELSSILDMSAPAISQKLKKTETSDLLKSEKNRTVGIPRETIAQILTDHGFGYFFRKNIFLNHTIVGGSMKTTGCWSLFNAFIRISSKKNPCIIISTDSQGSIDEIAMGHIKSPEQQQVLADYFNGACSLEDILLPLDEKENLWIIPSNLNNVFLDKSLSTPAKIKTEGLKLINEIYQKFPNTNPTIFIDTMPALSASSTSFILAMAQLMGKYTKQELNTVVGIPLRTDATSLKGAEIAFEELKLALETFGLMNVPEVKVYLANYDKRMSISTEIMKKLFVHEVLKDYVADSVIRTSTEITKRAYNHQSVFHDSLTPVAQDYQDLLLEFLGYEKSGSNA